MNSKALRIAYSLTMPGGLLLACAVLLIRLPIVPSRAGDIILWLPYAVFAVAALLSWRFNRSRVLYAVIVLAIIYRAVIHHVPIGSGGRGAVVLDAISLLLPVNLAAFAFLRERGTTTPLGVLRFALIGAQIVAVIVISRPELADIAAFLRYQLIHWPVLKLVRFSQPSLIAFLLSFIVLAVRVVWIRRPLETGFFWTLISAFLAVNAALAGRMPSLYFAAAGLILVIALIEMSHYMAFRDELTGMLARRAFNEAVLKLGDDYTIAMVDVDHFKKFNDSYGHDCGDQVLRMVASKLMHVPGCGQAFRYGGEEFAIIFAGKSAKNAVLDLEHLRQTIADAPFIVRGADRRKKKARGKPNPKAPRKTHVTVSIGVAERDEKHTFIDQVVDAADKALYRAKEAGRNRVEC